MNTNSIILILVFALTACGAPAGTPGAGGSCDWVGESGLCVSVDDDVTDHVHSFDLFEHAYLDEVARYENTFGADLSTMPAPSVQVVSFRPNGYDGYTDFGTGHITLRGLFVLRHEVRHYILWHLGYPDDLNSKHDHPVFNV